MGEKLKRHNGIEWDDGGRWADANDAEARIAELDNELTETLEFLQAVLCSEGVKVDVKGQLEIKRENTALKAQLADAHSWLVHVYNSGYLAGHHDTVESVFTDIHCSDMDTYHGDVVGELVKELSPDFTCPGCREKDVTITAYVNTVDAANDEIDRLGGRLEKARAAWGELSDWAQSGHHDRSMSMEDDKEFNEAYMQMDAALAGTETGEEDDV